MIFRNTRVFGVKKRIFRNTPSGGAKRILNIPESMSFNTARIGDFPVPDNGTDYYFPQCFIPSALPSLRLGFSSRVTIRVDYGDGTITSYNTILGSVNSSAGVPVFLWRWGISRKGPSATANPAPWDTSPHVYTDGLTSHTVTIYYPAGVLVDFRLDAPVLPVQDLAFGFSQHPSLNIFVANGIYSQLGDPATVDAAIVNLDLANIEFCQDLKVLALANLFHPTSTYFGAIPLPLLQAPLREISFGDKGFEGKTFTASNMNAIATSVCKDTIESISIAYKITDADGLPANFATLLKLWFISLSNTSYTAPPALLNTMPGLKYVTVRNSPLLTSFGNMGAITNLERVLMSVNPLLADTAPSWLNTTLKVKSIDVRLCYTTSRPGTLDHFIMTLYNLVTLIAPVTGTSTDLYRNVTFDCSRVSTTDATVIPSGSFVAPAGYVQDSDNGILSTDTGVGQSQERMWVLENQYGWNCIFRAT